MSEENRMYETELEESDMCEIVYRNQEDKDAAFKEVMRYGRERVSDHLADGILVIPLSPRAYHASVYYYLSILPKLDTETEERYKKEILDEWWAWKYNRNDEMIEFGVGKKEVLAIGLSESTFSEAYDPDDARWLWDENDELVFGEDLPDDLIENAPAFIARKDSRAEKIEQAMTKYNMLPMDVVFDNSDIAACFENEGLKDTEDLIEHFRSIRKCGVCEAVSEGAISLLERWSKRTPDEKGKD